MPTQFQTNGGEPNHDSRPSYGSPPNQHALDAAQERYNEERQKRLRQDGQSQFADLHTHEKFRGFQADPWTDIDPPRCGPLPPKDQERNEILIIGTGYAGLLFAVRLLQEGFKLEDIRMVDSAGGFGGTWCKCFTLKELKTHKRY